MSWESTRENSGREAFPETVRADHFPGPLSLSESPWMQIKISESRGRFTNPTLHLFAQNSNSWHPESVQQKTRESRKPEMRRQGEPPEWISVSGISQSTKPKLTINRTGQLSGCTSQSPSHLEDLTSPASALVRAPSSLVRVCRSARQNTAESRTLILGFAAKSFGTTSLHLQLR